VGVVKTFTFDEAQQQGGSGWRVPLRKKFQHCLSKKVETIFKVQKLTRSPFLIWNRVSTPIGLAQLLMPRLAWMPVLLEVMSVAIFVAVYLRLDWFGVVSNR